MLLNRSTATRDSATDIEKTSRKGAPEREQPKALYTRVRRMIREPNARMCGRDCEPAPRHPQTVYIPFTANQNLSVFARTQRELDAPPCTRCPLLALGSQKIN